MSTVPKDAKKSQKKTNLWCMDAISFSFRGVWTLKGLKTSGMHPLIMDLKHHLLILQPVLTLWRLDAEYVSSAFLLPSNCENKLYYIYIYIHMCVWNCVDMRSKQVNERNETTLLATHGYSFKCSLTCGRPQSDKTICSAVRVTKSVSSSGYVPPSPLKTNNRRQCLKDVESCLCESVLW